MHINFDTFILALSRYSALNDAILSSLTAINGYETRKILFAVCCKNNCFMQYRKKIISLKIINSLLYISFFYNKLRTTFRMKFNEKYIVNVFKF